MNEDQEAATIQTAITYGKAQERYLHDATYHKFVRGLIVMLTSGYDFNDLIAACALAATLQKDETPT